MRHWQIKFRVYHTKIAYYTIIIVLKSGKKFTKHAARNLAVKYWKYFYRQHHHNAGYYSLPLHYVHVAETKAAITPGLQTWS